MENFTFGSSNEPSTKADKPHEESKSPFEMLSEAEEQINPAIILAEELMRKGLEDGFCFDDIERAQTTLDASRREIEMVSRQFEAIVKSPASPSMKAIPKGF